MKSQETGLVARVKRAWQFVASKDSIAGSTIVLLLILGVYLILAWNYCQTSRMNADEGFYCLAAKMVLEGEIPYRDFAYPQMPVLPYLNGLAMKIVGVGFLEQRVINGLWGLLALLTVFWICSCMAARYVGLVAAWLTGSAVFWVHYVCMGKTYAAAGLFVMLSALALCVPWSYYKKVVLFSVAGALAIGCRLTVFPAVLVLGLFLVLQADRTKDRIIAVALPLISGAVVFLPFFLAGQENFIFWNFGYHLASTINRRGWMSIEEHLWLAPGVLLMIVAAAIWIVRRPRQLEMRALGILLAAIAGIGTQLLLKSGYGENSVPFVGLAAVGTAALLSKWPWFKRLCPVVVLFPLLAFLVPRPVTEDNLLDSLYGSSEFLQAKTDPHERVLTSLPIVAIEAQREVFDNLEMGMFALTSEMSEQRARRLHLVTPGVLIGLIRAEKPPAVVLWQPRSPWNFGMSVPSLRPADPRQIDPFFEVLSQRYYLAHRRDKFTIALPKGQGTWVLSQ